MTNYVGPAKDARDCREAAKRARRFDDRIGCDVGRIYLRPRIVRARAAERRMGAQSLVHF